MIWTRVLRRWRWIAALALCPVLVASVAVGIAYGKGGWYAVNVMLRRGANVWGDVAPDDSRLSPGIRLSLAGRRTPDAPEPARWRRIATGLEVAELPVRVGGRPVDALLLSRIDPARYRFRVLNRPAGDRDVGDWMKATGASLVVNGSYYGRHGTPDTPVISDGWSLATALSLLVWFIYAPMCISTLATIKRETNSWRQMGFAAFYLFALAYLASLVTYQVASALGAG